MSILVVCGNCKKRFNVSDKFAGQKGPCPSCKTVIEIPKKEDEVQVHAPESAGPKDSKGHSVIVPILREETNIDRKVVAGILVAIVVLFGASFFVGRSYKENKKDPSKVPVPLLAIVAITLGPTLSFAGYSFLRNDELEPYRGKEVWTRASICGIIYAVFWGVFSALPWALNMKFETMHLLFVAAPIVLAGGFTAFACFELDYVIGIIHYSLYLIVTVLLRVVAGMDAF